MDVVAAFAAKAAMLSQKITLTCLCTSSAAKEAKRALVAFGRAVFDPDVLAFDKAIIT
jgi:hypothetical protein